MDASAITASVQIPFKAVFVAGFLHFLKKAIVTLLALRPADDLPFPGDEHIAGRDGLAIVVFPHVEGLDVFGVIGEENRPFDYRFGYVAFVLGLQIEAPVNVVFLKLMAVLHRFLQNIDGFGIGHAPEGGMEDGGKLFLKPWANHLVEELHLVWAVFKDVIDAEFDGFLH